MEVYERRPQPKSDPIDLKRTYIIALSERGLKAMRAAGVRIPSDSPYKGFVRHTQGGKIQVDCNNWTHRDKLHRNHAGKQIAATLGMHALHMSSCIRNNLKFDETFPKSSVKDCDHGGTQGFVLSRGGLLMARYGSLIEGLLIQQSCSLPQPHSHTAVTGAQCVGPHSCKTPTRVSTWLQQ